MKYQLVKALEGQYIITRLVKKGFFKKREEWEIVTRFDTQEQAEDYLNFLVNGVTVIKEVEVKEGE